MVTKIDLKNVKFFEAHRGVGDYYTKKIQIYETGSASTVSDQSASTVPLNNKLLNQLSSKKCLFLLVLCYIVSQDLSKRFILIKTMQKIEKLLIKGVKHHF